MYVYIYIYIYRERERESEREREGERGRESERYLVDFAEEAFLLELVEVRHNVPLQKVD